MGGLARIVFRESGRRIFPGKFLKIFPENFFKKDFEISLTFCRHGLLKIV
jgi:hypothetical protein